MTHDYRLQHIWLLQTHYQVDEAYHPLHNGASCDPWQVPGQCLDREEEVETGNRHPYWTSAATFHQERSGFQMVDAAQPWQPLRIGKDEAIESETEIRVTQQY